jgi:hypothetical protein
MAGFFTTDHGKDRASHASTCQASMSCPHCHVLSPQIHVRLLNISTSEKPAPASGALISRRHLRGRGVREIAVKTVASEF